MGRAGTIFDGRSSKGTAPKGCLFIIFLIVALLIVIEECIRNGKIGTLIFFVIGIAIVCLAIYFKKWK